MLASGGGSGSSECALLDCARPLAADSHARSQQPAGLPSGRAGRQSGGEQSLRVLCNCVSEFPCVERRNGRANDGSQASCAHKTHSRIRNSEAKQNNSSSGSGGGDDDNSQVKFDDRNNAHSFDMETFRLRTATRRIVD